MFNSVYRLGFASNLRNLTTRCVLINCHKHNLKFYQQRCFKQTKSDKNKIMAEHVSKIINDNTNSSETKKFKNRLSTENSPYLLQHAHNPVDWYPWGDEAIKRAKEENKMIFLSVGYSTCHWCHVMEKESFENEEVAKIMNKHFINIKVDREERPDIDKIYMTFVLMVSGSGGWPMSVWLTPDLAPVTAGTYFPPTDRWGMAGFTSVLLRLAKKWNESGAEMTASGRSIIDIIQKQSNEKNPASSDDNPVTVEGKYKQCLKIFIRNYDDEYGGFGRAPKFPEISKLNLLFHMFLIDPKNGLAKIVLETLKKIANGGIHDHVFGGFARYAVDRKWHVPHFEKMLYDQGQLLTAYTNAYKITRDKFYLEVSNCIFKYLMKDLLHPRGGFYSGEDADSLPTHESKDKIEGAFYAWNFSEINEIFKENKNSFSNIQNIDPFKVYCFHYDIKENGNVEPSSDPHGHLLGKNILFVNGSIEETANKFRVGNNVIEDILRIGNEIVYEVRCQRPRPHLDTKIICSWNGLVLSGLSKLACIKDAPRRQEYQSAADNLVEFINSNLYNSEDDTLLRSCYGDNSSENITEVSEPISGFLDDYAFLIKGLLDYYISTMDESILHWAKNLQDTQDALFWDMKNGAYFYSRENSPNVIIRLKEDHDGAEPSGNSVSLHNLLLLSAYFDDKVYKDKASKLVEYFNNISPFGYTLPEMMSGLLLYDKGLDMLVIVGPSDNEDTKNLLDATRNYYTPGLITINSKVDEPDKLTRKAASQFKMIGKRPTAFLCHNKICQLPLTDPAMLSETFAEKFLYKCDK